MIISASDFSERPYKVPNQNESQDFGSFIESAEETIAVEYLLGYTLWEEFKSAVETSGSIPIEFQALRDGETYTYGGITYVYKGWVDLIRPAIYSLWIPEGTQKFTNSGWVTNKANSAPQAGNQSELMEDPYQYEVKYWNEFVKKTGPSYKNTFYGYMQAQDFDEWEFRCPKVKNRLDI